MPRPIGLRSTGELIEKEVVTGAPSKPIHCVL